MIGSTTIAPAPTTHLGTADPERTAERLALLTARTGLEPELAQRYLSNPVSVLAEFGLAAEPVYMELADSRSQGLSLEDLDGTAADAGSFCNFTHSPAAESRSFCNFTHSPAADSSFCNFTHAPAQQAASFCNFTHAPDRSAASFCNFTHRPDAAAGRS
ncbi:hypothetical protein RM717_30950 [Streptomyces griseus]|uniref:Uncharacterized protein n=1 Tax=Streptomyces stephensoniae TaxID=3375367 RepID=A0ABU2WCA8_9ACTN|nr:hypothetical protein [Streptomyces griseus]MDT0494919.1 hypothetical protein [Streptomyces griseus]